MSALLIALLLQAGAPAPEWLRLPPPDALQAYYPEAAAKAGIEGRATMECTFLRTGTLGGCRIVEEDPPGAGFGEAVLKLQSMFRGRPIMQDGRAVDGGIVRMPVVFKRPPPALDGAKLAWRRVPTAVDFARAYPERALRKDLEGAAAIRCTVSEDRRLSACETISRDPDGVGFGEAALRLARYFELSPGAAAAGAKVVVPIRFVLPRG